MGNPASALLVFATLVLLSCHHGGSSPTSTLPTITSLSKLDNVTDRDALLSFKSMILNASTGPLASWNGSTHYCRWPGVTCGGPRHPQRVVALNFTSSNLTGSISPTLANLTFLKSIDLSNNQFHGIIPQEINRLSRLQYLDLSANILEGGIPDSLSRCSKLQVLNLSSNTLESEIPPSLGNCLDLQIISLGTNKLIGRIPPSLTNLSSLSYLDLAENHLSGIIPPSIGNLQSLTQLYLYNNQFLGGIPPSLGKLSRLRRLLLHTNNLTDTIPPTMWNLSSLTILDLSNNELSGSLPPHAGQAFTLLKQIYLNDNQFHGPIPLSLSNASHLNRIHLATNTFTGTIPPNLGSLQNLHAFILSSNKLEAKEPNGWSFLTSLANCTNLEILQLHNNRLGGVLPDSIGNLSTNLQMLTMQETKISGNIPPEIGKLVGLNLLDINTNLLTGPIPKSMGMLQNLIILDCSYNSLSGEIPSTLGNLSLLNNLYLDNNELSGNIPATLGNCRNLNLLNLDYNRLTGSIPKEIFTISTLAQYLGLASNSLTGTLPSEVGNLRNLGTIVVSMNKLSGELPKTLGECQLLEALFLNKNFFRGGIPTSLGSLRGIQVLDISENNLSGRIPDSLQDIHSLNYLNLSFNNFEGEVPSLGVFENASSVSVAGNNKLCGRNPKMHLPACPSRSQNRKHHSHTLVLIISLSSSFLFLFVLLCLLVVRHRIHKSKTKPQEVIPIQEYVRVSYAELMRATNGFSEGNVIGRGSFGTVYRGVLDGDSMEIIAVKVLNLDLRGATKSFIAECEALRNIRHRNLVKILTACSSVDFKGNDFKAMIFKFMSNGSLDHWLHSGQDEQTRPNKLSFLQRIIVAIDVASALDYLHHHGGTSIVHCDLKPSNILLDEDMTAHLGDFGLARFIKETVAKSSQYSTSSIGLKGTIGYVAPEYGMANEISTLGDVYSYGILILEMFTGKRPIDDIFKEGLTIRKFVESAFPDRLMAIIDEQLFLGEDRETNEDAQSMNNAKIVECVALLLKIGVSCSSELPTDRREIEDILKELIVIKDMFITDGNEEQRRSRAQIRPEDPSTVV